VQAALGEAERALQRLVDARATVAEVLAPSRLPRWWSRHANRWRDRWCRIGKTFTDPHLCAAIVDRLTFNGAIIQTGTDSYRLAHIKVQAQQAAAS
jgi:hypothetical protein